MVCLKGKQDSLEIDAWSNLVLFLYAVMARGRRAATGAEGVNLAMYLCIYTHNK